jgi:hypothetical protein
VEDLEAAAPRKTFVGRREQRFEQLTVGEVSRHQLYDPGRIRQQAAEPQRVRGRQTSIRDHRRKVRDHFGHVRSRAFGRELLRGRLKLSARDEPIEGVVLPHGRNQRT